MTHKNRRSEFPENLEMVLKKKPFIQEMFLIKMAKLKEEDLARVFLNKIPFLMDMSFKVSKAAT